LLSIVGSGGGRKHNTLQSYASHLGLHEGKGRSFELHNIEGQLTNSLRRAPTLPIPFRGDKKTDIRLNGRRDRVMLSGTM
jgi:hypothetical protein